MRIRLATTKDLPEVVPHLKALWIMHGKNNPQFLNYDKMKQYTDARIKKYLNVCFDKSKKSYLLIAEEEGNVAGFLKIDIVEIQKFFIVNKVIYLDDIFVKEEFRGKGVAKLLQQEAEKIAKKKKIKMLKARIYAFNTPAQKMAQSMGLTPLYSEYFKPLK
jgi:GNAT superfamily N-acetyltransferase